MKTFNQILATLPSIEHLAGLNVRAGDNLIQHIPAIEGKLGSLKVYHALAQQFDGKLDRQAAEQGLALFAEHSADAKAHAGKHPNIDLLFKVIAEDHCYQLELVEKA